MPGTGRSLSSALKWIKSKVGATSIGGRSVRRQCLAIVRQTWGLGTSGIGTAYEGWKLAGGKHHNDYNAPPGAPCWFKGPTSAGHVATSVGNGYVIGNDWPTPGVVKKAKIRDIERGWNCDYLGWTEYYPRADGNDVKLPLDLVSSKPTPAEFKVGMRVVVSEPLGIKARTGPGTESSTLSYVTVKGKKKIRTVAKGYRIKITKLATEDGYIWGRADKYWYALRQVGGSVFVRKV